MCQMNVVEGIKTQIFLFNGFLPTVVSFMRSCARYCRAGQAADVNIVRHMRFACWIIKATHTHTLNSLAIFLQTWGTDIHTASLCVEDVQTTGAGSSFSHLNCTKQFPSPSFYFLYKREARIRRTLVLPETRTRHLLLMCYAGPWSVRSLNTH